MNSWLLFLLKSTLILSTLNLLFFLLIRKDTSFVQSRLVLVFIIVFSIIFPLIHAPGSIDLMTMDNLEPVFQTSSNIESPILTKDISSAFRPIIPVSDSRQTPALTTETILLIVYMAGVFVSLFLFFFRLLSVLRLIRKTRSTELIGIRLMIADDDIPAFSFRKNILISKFDYETNSEAILTHELSHISHGHFYDLMLMEFVKIMHWFNPVVHMMNRDMKDIHEFQADAHTLNSGIDVAKYQLLIIKKCVGSQKFALANSFNHCQIKNRITMMNKSKNAKVWNWKVATFIPLLVFLLMAFGKKEEIQITEKSSTERPIPVVVSNQHEQFTQRIEIRKDGNFINNKQCTLDEITLQDKNWRSASNSWIYLSVDESVPLKRIDEVRTALEGNYWVVQTTVDSDDLVYFAGDVSQLAKFAHGNWSDWCKSKLNDITKGKFDEVGYKISLSMIIDKNGKVRDAHITNESEYPEINAAYTEMLTQMPEWEPASRGSEKVSVYYAVIISQRVSD